MDEIAKSLERQYELGLSENQSKKIDLVFQEFMREYHIPKSLPVKDQLLKFKYLRKALLLLTQEQLNKYRTKRFEVKSKAKIREKQEEERKLKHLRTEYKSVNLTNTQIQILLERKNSFRKRIMDLNEQQESTLKALNESLSNDQLKELRKIFEYQLHRRSRNLIESTKRQYAYLNLTDDQASEISVLEELEKEDRRKNGYKNYNPLQINQDFKEILNQDQFALYSKEQEQKKENHLQQLIKEDVNIKDRISEIEDWIQFQIENILPIKCAIRNQLLDSASETDINNIERLKERYDKELDYKISVKKQKHKDKYGSQIPNQLKLSIIRLSSFDISPSPDSLKDIDLNKNEFSSIQLDPKQETKLESIRNLQRDYNIKKIEEKIKSYGSLISAGRDKIIPKFYELYGILLLEDNPEKNIEKMKMRQIKHIDENASSN